MSIIEIKNLNFSYTAKQPVLRGLTLDVTAGSFLAIVGPNGAGKSTLLNLLSGLLRCSSGTINVDSRSLKSYSSQSLARKIAVVRQQTPPPFGFSVLETVLMARTAFFTSSGFESSEDLSIVDEALRATDTFAFKSRPLTSLSGGERQRVFIARALAQNTSILLLDEPTSFLDLRHQVKIYDLLKVAQVEKSKTIIAATHDINLAAQYADSALLLKPAATHRGESSASSLASCFEYGAVHEVLTPQNVEKTFAVETFVSTVGSERFFLPLGSLAKDRRILSRQNKTDRI